MPGWCLLPCLMLRTQDKNPLVFPLKEWKIQQQGKRSLNLNFMLEGPWITIVSLGINAEHVNMTKDLTLVPLWTWFLKVSLAELTNAIKPSQVGACFISHSLAFKTRKSTSLWRNPLLFYMTSSKSVFGQTFPCVQDSGPGPYVGAECISTNSFYFKCITVSHIGSFNKIPGILQWFILRHSCMDKMRSLRSFKLGFRRW